MRTIQRKTRDPFRWAAVEFNGRSYTCLYTFLGLYLPTYLPINNAIVFIILLCASASSSRCSAAKTEHSKNAFDYNK